MLQIEGSAAEAPPEIRGFQGFTVIPQGWCIALYSPPEPGCDQLAAGEPDRSKSLFWLGFSRGLGVVQDLDMSQMECYFPMRK